jgi:aryl-alcohol dehydrogenase-like predicted oxidoreductase
MLHNFDPLTPIEETLAALDMLKRQGKIRYIGCSNFAAWQIAATMGAAHSRALPRLEVIEAMYTIAAREIEAEILAAAKYFDMSVMVWGALAAGLLTGKYNPPGGAPPADARLTLGGTTIAERGKAFAAVEAMRPIAESKGVSVAQIALAWLLLNQSVASIVIGCKRPDQLEHNLAALDVSFTPDEIERLNAIAAPRLEYPYSMQAAMAARRNPS